MEAGPSLREVSCYVLVAQRLNFSRAAAELGMSQSAVSQTVARLERVLGLRLFDRSSREVRLTDAGQFLLPHAEELLERAGAFASEADRLARSGGESIRLAYDPLTGSLAARAVQRLSRKIKVELRPSVWSEAAGAAVFIMSTPFPPGLVEAARFQIPVRHIAVSTSDPLAGASRIQLSQLHRRTVLMPRSRPPGSIWAQLVNRLQRAGVSFREGDGHDDWTAALDLVAAGRGLLPAPTPLADTVRRPDISFIPLEDVDLMLTYGVVWSPEHANADTLTLVQTIQDLLRSRARSLGR